MIRKKSWFKISAHLALITFIITSILAPVALAGEKVFFYHTDPVGTPLSMTDSTGQKVWQAYNKPFGEEYSAPGTETNDRTFVGKEKDDETGLHYFGARYHDSKIGRFISPDPVGAVDPFSSQTNQTILGNPQRLNYYAYSLNNPYRYVDPDGEFTYLVRGIIVAGKLIHKGYKLYKKANKINKIKKPSPKKGSKGGPGAGKEFSKSTKDKVRQESENTCVFCGDKTTRQPGPKQSHLDHAIPKVRDGNNSIQNAQNSCRTCNLEKGARTTKEYLKQRK